VPEEDIASRNLLEYFDHSASSIVLLVMLEIGGASGKRYILDFLGVSSPEMVSWRFTDFEGGSRFRF